ncbi:hypothetical protein AVEN_151424-1 [Araneus ventricosus]|uniref:Uncharacterized protein n=1 Tax=Araneus ventricosus TaxID=182803 RepID=A0A4Y2RD21_ARAVE|nr:hypothetical protein AVEN_151424-1 [Araneus ventricosus]
MKWPSGVPWCMTTTWSTTYVVEKCDVMWKLPHPVLTGGSERQLRKLTSGIDLSDYNVGWNPHPSACEIVSRGSCKVVQLVPDVQRIINTPSADPLNSLLLS